MEQNQNPVGSQQLPTPNSQPATNSKHFKAFWPIVLIATMSAVIGGLVVWAAFNAGLDEELNSLLPGADRRIAKQHKNFEIQPMTSQANESTTDWQTYRNEEFGFEFMYPQDWSVRLNDRSSSLEVYSPEYIKRYDQAKTEKWSQYPPSNITLLFYKDISRLAGNLSVSEAANMSELIQKGKNIGFANLKQFSFLGLEAYKADLIGLFDAEIIFFEKNGKFYEFSLDRQYNPDLATESYILSTFKFTK